jgi:hypothetical protein
VLAGQIDLPIARIGGKLIGNHLQKLATQIGRQSRRRLHDLIELWTSAAATRLTYL